MRNYFCHLSAKNVGLYASHNFVTSLLLGPITCKISWNSSQGNAYCCTFQRETQVFTMDFPCSSSNMNKHETPRPTLRIKALCANKYLSVCCCVTDIKKYETKPIYYKRHKYARIKWSISGSISVINLYLCIDLCQNVTSRLLP